MLLVFLSNSIVYILLYEFCIKGELVFDKLRSFQPSETRVEFASNVHVPASPRSWLVKVHGSLKSHYQLNNFSLLFSYQSCSGDHSMDLAWQSGYLDSQILQTNVAESFAQHLPCLVHTASLDHDICTHFDHSKLHIRSY